MPVGEIYTVSFEINVSDNGIQFQNDMFYVNGASENGTHNKPTLVKDKWVKVYATFNYTVENNSMVHIYISGMPAIDTIQIRNFQLEKGDIATDWTEAPEDVEARIGEKADQSNLDAVVGDVDAIKEDLDTKVDKNTFIAQQAAYEEWLTRVDLSATTAEQLAATLELATILIDTDLKGQAQRWSTLEGFVQIDAATGTFTIRSNNNGTQMVLTDDAMSFLSGGELVATITNQYLQIARGIFTSSAQIGRHKFEPLASDPDHFVLSYVGQN